MSRRPSRIQALLGLTLGLAVLFGLVAWRAVRTERHKVTMATCMFAADAARVLQAHAISYLETITDPIFAAIGGRAPVAPSGPIPGPEALRDANQRITDCHCVPQLSAIGFFRFDPDRNARSGALHLIPAMAGWTPEVDSGRVATAVLRAIRDLHDGGIVAAAVTSTSYETDTLRAVAVIAPKVATDGSLRAVYGILVSPDSFAQQVVVREYEHVPVFPVNMLSPDSGRHTWLCCHDTYRRNSILAYLEVMDWPGRLLYQNGPIADTAETAPGCVGFAVPDSRLAAVNIGLSPPLPILTRWTDMNMAVSQVPLLVVLLIALLVSMIAAGFAVSRESELTRLRSDFVTSISHELRMPLAQILLSGETLSLGRTRSQLERDEAADAIVREAHRLTGLVDNALFFSRIEHHNIDIATEPVELADVAAETIAGIGPLAHGAGVILVNAVPLGLAALVDRAAFRQVLYNLIENAVKYGPPGQRVVLGAAPSSTSDGRVNLWVEDEGAGIPEDKVMTIFQPFVRLERDRNRGIAGSGLGLAVVQHIVELHQGRVWVEPSSTGTGSRFVIDLPRAPAPAVVTNPTTNGNGRRTAANRESGE